MSHLTVKKLMVLLLFSTFLGCARSPQKTVYQSGKNRILLKKAAVDQASLAPFDHPKKFTPDQIYSLLDQVLYQENIVVSYAWGKPKPVFTSAEKTLLAAQIPEIFERVSSQEVVSFVLQNPENRQETTEGLLYALSGELHLLFSKIRQPDYLTDAKPYQLSRKWRLVPQKNQHLFSTRATDKGKETHWLVIALTKGEKK